MKDTKNTTDETRIQNQPEHLSKSAKITINNLSSPNPKDESEKREKSFQNSTQQVNHESVPASTQQSTQDRSKTQPINQALIQQLHRNQNNQSKIKPKLYPKINLKSTKTQTL